MSIKPILCIYGYLYQDYYRAKYDIFLIVWHGNDYLRNAIMFKNIVGRINEMQILSDSLNSHRSELIAIYGRRRIGKTYLIREFFSDKIIFSFTGLSKGTKTNQIKNFTLKLNDVTTDFKKKKQPTDWLEAFSYTNLTMECLFKQV